MSGQVGDGNKVENLHGYAVWRDLVSSHKFVVVCILITIIYFYLNDTVSVVQDKVVGLDRVNNPSDAQPVTSTF